MLGPALVGRDEGEDDLRLRLGRQLALGLLRGLLEPLERHAVAGEVDAVLFLELFHEPVDDQLVEVLAAEVGVSARSQHLVDAVVQLEDRDVERAAAEVVDGDLARGALAHAVGERRGRGLVQDALDLEPRDRARVLGRLPLRVVEIGGHRNDGLFHRLPEVVLGGRLELLQHDGGDLGRAVDLVVDLEVRVTVRRLDDLVRENLERGLHLGRVEPAADEPLDAVDRVLRVGQCLAFRDLADQPLALVGEGDDRRGRTRAFLVGNDLGRSALHDDDARVRRSEIDTNDLTHCNAPWFFVSCP